MPRFIPDTIIQAIHEDQIYKYGGNMAIRNPDGLHSAQSMPQARFSGELLHSTIYEQAAAYGFHLCQNHPFIDGNKRTAGMVMLTYLKLNGFDPIASEDEYYETMMAVARGEMSKELLATWLQQAVKPYH